MKGSFENMSFLIKSDEAWQKYEEIWNVIKNNLSIKFNCEAIYENIKIFKN